MSPRPERITAPRWPPGPPAVLGARTTAHNNTMNQPNDALETPPITAIILCRVLELEIEHFVARSDHVVHIERLEQGLHNEPRKLHQRVQACIDQIEQRSEITNIVLGYGLCSRGVEGLRTRRCTLIVPRAHDCITLLLGDKSRYQQYVAKHPGTYWYSPGWIQHHLPPGPQRHAAKYREYCEKYGEDNAQFLMETESHWHDNYDRATYIDVGIGRTEQDVQFTRDCATWLGWEFDQQQGDPDLIRELVEGPWDDARFLTVPPGKTVRMTGDDRVIDICARSEMWEE